MNRHIDNLPHEPRDKPRDGGKHALKRDPVDSNPWHGVPPMPPVPHEKHEGR